MSDKESKKYCPLKFAAKVGSDCDKEKCAWWENIEESCALTVIGTAKAYELMDRDRR